MKHIPSKVILCCAIILSTVTFQFTGCSSDKEPDGPHIAKLTPDIGPIGTEVVITGKGMFGTGGFKVKFNGVEAKIVGLKDDETEITVLAPNGGSTGPVTIVAANQELTGPTFTYDGEPTTKSKYYVKFKANDSWIMYETGEPGYSTCGNCSCNSVPPQPFGDIDNATIEVCNEQNNDWVTAADILALKNKTLSFSSGYPHPMFRYDFKDSDLNSEDAVQVSGSTMTITDVISEPPFAGLKPVFRVVGTFSCKVAKSDGTGTINITEGKFAVRFTED